MLFYACIVVLFLILKKRFCCPFVFKSFVFVSLLFLKSLPFASEMRKSDQNIKSYCFVPKLTVFQDLFAESYYYTKKYIEMSRSSPPQVFLGKGVLKVCSKFIGEHPCQSVVSIKLLCNDDQACQKRSSCFNSK